MKTDPSTIHDGNGAGPFVADMQAIRQRAQSGMDKGARTDSYGLSPEHVIEVLDQVMATEIICTLRYMAHYYACDGVDAEVAGTEFKEHADEEWSHAMTVAARIAQLGGTPDLRPDTLTTRAHADYNEPGSLREMVEEDLVAERIAIQTYQEIIRWLGDRDPTSRRMMEEILAKEEEHADDMLSLLQGSRLG